MVIKIIVITITTLLLISIKFNIKLWKIVKNGIHNYIETNLNYSIDDYFEEQIEEKFPCTLLLTVYEGVECNSSIYDFSQYEQNNIIGLFWYRQAIVLNNKENLEDTNTTTILPNQIVCKMKDGGYQWDLRHIN